MKIHATHEGKNYYGTVGLQSVLDKRINDEIPGPVSGFPQGRIVIRGASGQDGTPIRADFFGVVPTKIRIRPHGPKKRYRPNRIDKGIAVVDCIIVSPQSPPSEE